MKRLLQLTKRLKKNEAMLRRYDHAISEYVTLGVAETRILGTSRWTMLPHAT